MIEWFRRVQAMIEKEKAEPLAWWWLSFADETGFLGGCAVEARGMIGAIRWAHRMDANPGGSVQASLFRPDRVPPPDQRNRLLSPAEVEVLFSRT